MNSAGSEAALIGLDWGTTSLRAYLMGADGGVIDQISAPGGIMQIENRDFDPVFDRLVQPWRREAGLPVLAAGMITSRNGWVETPYLPLSAGTGDLAAALTPFSTRAGIDLNFVTGVVTEHGGVPDVMRGEETQIIGLIASGLEAGLVVLPGTHSKWVTVRDSRIEDFRTFMTGDVFAALRHHTILAALIEEGNFDETAFRKGVTAGLSDGAALLHRLFDARALPLFDRLSGVGAADYLSGLLIGAEISAGVRDLPPDTAVTIVGRGDLAARYACALDAAGLCCQLAPENIVARGLFEIAQSAGIIA